MVTIEHELGPGACYAFWLLLERIAEPWDGTTPPELNLPLREWRKISLLSEKKLKILLEILHKEGVIQSTNSGKSTTLKADIILKLKDETTRKRQKDSGITPENNRNREVVPTVRTGNSDFLACLFPCQAAFNKLSW